MKRASDRKVVLYVCLAMKMTYLNQGHFIIYQRATHLAFSWLETNFLNLTSYVYGTKMWWNKTMCDMAVSILKCTAKLSLISGYNYDKTGALGSVG